MDDRHLRSTAFERTQSGFIYYENAWSKGIGVTAGEREIYLSGAHSEWLDIIVGRKATAPRRPWRQGAKRMLLAVWHGHDVESPD